MSVIVKTILFLFLCNSFLFSQNSPFIPKKIKDSLCETLEQSDSATNSCRNGSTIQYKSHLITSSDNLILFLYLDEHLATPPIYPPQEVGILVDKQGNWSYNKKNSYAYLKKAPKIKSNNWKILNTKKSITFTHKVTKKVITLPNITDESKIFYLQVGAYKQDNQRKKIQRSLARLPYPPHLATKKVGYKKYSKLLIGPFTTLEKVKFVKKMLPKKHNNAFIVTESKKK